jgi:WXXGXW repeat (2 copies)
MFMRKLLVFAIIAAGTLGAVAIPLPSMAASNVDIQLNFGPPAPRYEPVPAPRSGYIWSPGHWAWDGYRHVWVAGHWEGVRPGYAYYAPSWVERRGRWYYQPSHWDPIPAVAASNLDIQLNVGPPPPRYEPVPAPRSGYIWSPGYWAWDGRSHVWTGGHWERARPGYSYHAPTWVQRDGRWYHQASRWDSDGDGIPDHRDRTPYGSRPGYGSIPYRDSDRDGIPDYRDRTPYGSRPCYGSGQIPGYGGAPGSGPGTGIPDGGGIPSR